MASSTNFLGNFDFDTSPLPAPSHPNVRFADSSRSSVYSDRSSARDRHDITAKFIAKKAREARWFEQADDDYAGSEESVTRSLGVILRRPDGQYTAEPMFLDSDVVGAFERLGLVVALTMSSEIVWEAAERVRTLMPVANTVRDIGTSRCTATRESFACYCIEEKFILVWSQSVKQILAHASDVENTLMGLVWGGNITIPDGSQTPQYRPSRPSVLTPRYSSQSSVTNFDPAVSEKLDIVTAALEKEEHGNKHYDPEKQKDSDFDRPFLLLHALMIGLAVVLVIVVELACVAKLITEIRLDGDMLRLALVAAIPVFASFSLFFMIVIAGSLFQLFGPLPTKNSRYYSCIAPKLGRYPDYQLPHITIQLPVYKEGLKNVIIPTVNSLNAAIRHYESQGGSANIFVNEDGLQLVNEEQAEARIAFYELHGIGWCSRPGHNVTFKNEKGKIKKLSKDDPAYSERGGQFKKASNMNYCLDFSLKVEKEFEQLLDMQCQNRGCSRADLTVDEELKTYDVARSNIVDGDNGRTWAAGDCRVGELILIVDSDTRVPEDCLIYAALEMHESPEVGILQHSSGVMNVTGSIFENGFEYFTDLIYTSIQFAVGSGDCGPFVGHNSILRWKAIQSIAEQDKETGRMLFWSESHVSEDFDVSLRLQMAGFIVRLATYHNGGFQEGVSLTVYDELLRWEKYAFGVNELVFHPLWKWYKGPFTRLFWRFVFSPIKITSKITIFAYIFTYYAISSAIPLTLVNYLVVGWFNDNIDQFYLTSWQIFVGMAVVFNVLSPLAYAMLRHRLGKKTFFWSVVETVKWTPMFLVFFGGLSFSLSKSILCHFFSIKMEWTTTAKELEEHGFRAGLDRIIRDFKAMYLFVVAATGGMIYLAIFAPRGWRISDFAAIVPLANQVACHALLPFALGLF